MDYIKIYENVLTSDECKNIISIIESSPKIEGKVLNIFGENIININKKKCISANYEFENFEDSIQKQIIKHIENYTNNYKYCPNFGSFKITLKKYFQNEGFHTRHVDSNNIFASRRFLAFIIYLNTVDEGGETSFYIQGETHIKPVEGNMLIFPPFWMYEHEGKIPKTQDKYIITGFLNYEVL